MQNNSRYKLFRSFARGFYILGASLLIGSLVISLMPIPQAFAQNSGSIWTTSGNCLTPNPQDQNIYNVGDHVVVRGDNFIPGTDFDWSITGQPGGASGDPNVVVASGSATIDADGYFCVNAYTIPADDWGTYNVVASGKQDNYRVNEADPTPTDPPPTATPTDPPPTATPTDPPPTATPTDPPPTATPTDPPPTATPTDPPPTATATDTPPTATPTDPPPTATATDTPPTATPTDPPPTATSTPVPTLPPPAVVDEELLIPVTGPLDSFAAADGLTKRNVIVSTSSSIGFLLVGFGLIFNGIGLFQRRLEEY